MKQSFEIPGALAGLNEWTEACNSHYMSSARLKRENEEIVYWAAKAAKLKPMKTPLLVRITWIEGLRPGRKQFRKRDRDNIEFAQKFVLDALKSPNANERKTGCWRLGIFPDDDYDHIYVAHSHFVNRNNPRIIVELEEVDHL